ncbi:MAG TPA: transcription antitermination factor NusB [Syntrophomonadaceae bacterium]|nr:transcription antitermination factor NusB [Syntrophomonadaceae bacterium]
MSRRKAREAAFKVLFQVDQVRADSEQALAYLVNDHKLTADEQEFARLLIESALSNLQEIDASISQFSTDWALQRISAVDRSIMRMAIAEMRYVKGTQSVVAIDEAIEIAKRFGEENSPGFVNAILDRVRSDNTVKNEGGEYHTAD